MEKLRTVSRVEVLNTYKIRFLARENSGLYTYGWSDVLKNIETCQLESIEIGRLNLNDGKVAIIFIADKIILGCLELGIPTDILI